MKIEIPNNNLVISFSFSFLSVCIYLHWWTRAFPGILSDASSAVFRKEGGTFGSGEDTMGGGGEDEAEEWKGSVSPTESLLPFCVFVLYIIADKTSLENARTVCEIFIKPET